MYTPRGIASISRALLTEAQRDRKQDADVAPCAERVVPGPLATIEASMGWEWDPPGLPQKAEGRAGEDICDPFAAGFKPPLIPEGICTRQVHPEQPSPPEKTT